MTSDKVCAIFEVGRVQALSIGGILPAALARCTPGGLFSGRLHGEGAGAQQAGGNGGTEAAAHSWIRYAMQLVPLTRPSDAECIAYPALVRFPGR